MKQKQVVYIGPTVPGVVECNRIFIGALPKQVRELANANIAFRRMLIPVERLIEARKELKKNGSVLAFSYGKMQEYLDEM